MQNNETSKKVLKFYGLEEFFQEKYEHLALVGFSLHIGKGLTLKVQSEDEDLQCHRSVLSQIETREKDLVEPIINTNNPFILFRNINRFNYWLSHRGYFISLEKHNVLGYIYYILFCIFSLLSGKRRENL